MAVGAAHGVAGEGIIETADLDAGCSPGLEHLFELTRMRNDRSHYERTLREWRHRLRANSAAATDLVGEDVVKKYEKYLSLFMIGFHTATMNLSRFAFKRIDTPRGS